MIPMPSVTGMYNSNMGGIDRLDKNVAKYRIVIRVKKKKMVHSNSVILAECMYEQCMVICKGRRV